jgi:hypothetical protein
MLNKRPVSFSESHIYFGNLEAEKPFLQTKLIIRDISVNQIQEQEQSQEQEKSQEKDQEQPLTASASASTSASGEHKTTYLEFTVDYSMRFIFHIFLISIFEALFFFAFVSKDEDNGILLTTNYFTNSILDSCTGLNSSELEILNSVFSKFVNSTQVVLDGSFAASHRSNFNRRLFMIAWNYVGGLGGLGLSLLLFSKFMKFRIKWGNVVLENFALVAFLGIYEFMFFETIIKKYSSETPQEISALFVLGLQRRCGLQ